MQKVSRLLMAAIMLAVTIASIAPAARADVTYYSPPKFKHKVVPAYPETAKARHETGKVIVKVLVLQSGKAAQFILFKSSGHKDLDDAVMAAMKASTYEPATRGGTPTTGFYDVTYVFNLTGLAEDEAASGDLSKKLASNPRDVNARIALGTNYLNQKQYQQAEDVFQAGTQTNPTSAKIWAYLGLAHFQDAQAQNDMTDPTKYKAAVDAYDQALKLDPHVETANVAAAAYFNYAFRLQQHNQTAEAMPYAQKAVAISPKEAQYYILVGELQTAQGDFANGIATLKKAESLDDKKSSLVTSRIIADEGNAELQKGDQAAGMADINRAEQVDSHAPFAYEYLFSYYMRTGKRAAAITPLTQLATLQPKEVQWHLQLASIYLGENNTVAARQEYQKAQAINPDSPDVQLGLAQLAAASGDMATVNATMQKVTANADPKAAATYESVIAIALLNASSGKSNYYQDAQRYAKQATAADANNGQAWYALGVADAQLNQKDDAKTALKKAYDIFKAQNNNEMAQQISDTYKRITGTALSGS